MNLPKHLRQENCSTCTPNAPSRIQQRTERDESTLAFPPIIFFFFFFFEKGEVMYFAVV